MSVDYRHCESCEESLYDEYVGCCTSCGNSLCTSCLVNTDDVSKNADSRYAFRYGYIFDSKNEELIKQILSDGFEITNEDGSFCYEDGQIVDDSAILSKYCPYCNGDNVDKEKVLEHLLATYNLDINEVWKEIKNK